MQARAMLLVSALLVAGCLEGEDDGNGATDGGTTDAGAPQVYAFGIRDCTSVIAAIGVPQSAVAPHLPDGWRSISLQEMGVSGAPNPGNEGNVGIDMFACEEVDGVAGPVEGGVYGSLWSAVEPPEEFRRDVTFHFVKWDVAVADAALREKLVAAGVPAVTAEATVDEFTQAPTGQASYASSIAFSNGWAASFEGVAAGPFPPTGSFVEYTAVPDGFVEYYAEYVFDPVAIGPVTVTLEGEGLALDMLGSAPVQGVAFAGIQTWENANVTIPSRS